MVVYDDDEGVRDDGLELLTELAKVDGNEGGQPAQLEKGLPSFQILLIRKFEAAWHTQVPVTMPKNGVTSYLIMVRLDNALSNAGRFLEDLAR